MNVTELFSKSNETIADAMTQSRHIYSDGFTYGTDILVNESAQTLTGVLQLATTLLPVVNKTVSSVLYPTTNTTSPSRLSTVKHTMFRNGMHPFRHSLHYFAHSGYFTRSVILGITGVLVGIILLLTAIKCIGICSKVPGNASVRRTCLDRKVYTHNYQRTPTENATTEQEPEAEPQFVGVSIPLLQETSHV